MGEGTGLSPAGGERRVAAGRGGWVLRFLVGFFVLPLACAAGSRAFAGNTLVWEDPSQALEGGAIEIYPGESVEIKFDVPQGVNLPRRVILLMKGRAPLAAEPFTMHYKINPRWTFPGSVFTAPLETDEEVRSSIQAGRFHCGRKRDRDLEPAFGQQGEQHALRDHPAGVRAQLLRPPAGAGFQKAAWRSLESEDPRCGLRPLPRPGGGEQQVPAVGQAAQRGSGRRGAGQGCWSGSTGLRATCAARPT